MAAQIMFLPIIALFGILFFIFWLIMLVDAATRKFKEETEKVIWILVILLTNLVGALIYYFVVYRKDKSLKWFWITFFVVLGIMLLLIIFIGLMNTVVSVNPVG